MQQRQQKLREQIKQEGIDAVLITNPTNVTYLTGFTGDSSFFMLTADQATIISDGRYTTQIANECPGLDAHIRPPKQTIVDAAAEVLEKMSVRSIGFESSHLTVDSFQKLREKLGTLEWKGSSNRVEKLRAIKDESEFEQIVQAIRITERCFQAFRATLRSDDREMDLADRMEMYVRQAGGRGTSFPVIAGVGERSALPHATPTSKRVSESPILLIDWGASGPLYKSDLTRVLYTRNNAPSRSGDNGSDEAKFAKIYDVVLRAQQKASQALRPGATGKVIDEAARSVIDEAGYKDNFNHSIGHGFGLQIHEEPFMRPSSETPLEAGMVVTIEPGIYLPDWGGIRIEDDFRITEDGAEKLSSLPNDLDSAMHELFG